MIYQRKLLALAFVSVACVACGETVSQPGGGASGIGGAGGTGGSTGGSTSGIGGGSCGDLQPTGTEILTCCAGEVCRGECVDGECTCFGVAGGCDPYGCCSHTMKCAPPGGACYPP